MTFGEAIALAGASFIVAGFCVLFMLFRLPVLAGRVFVESGNALGVLGDPTLNDDAKASAMQKAAIALFLSFALLTIGGVAALLLPVLAVWLAGQAGLISFDAVMAVALGWPFIVGSAIVMTLAAIVLLRRNKAAKPAVAGTDSYSGPEKLLHAVAFATRPLQVALSRMEDRTMGAAVRPTSDPVFIAGLPRSGTTLLLELFEGSGEFASHSYRAMPFVLTPLMWGRYMARFSADETLRERAHGDGMMVSVDSPEAFEEMLWMTFYPQRYVKSSIAVWKDRPKPDFEQFFGRHRDKIVHLAGSGEGRAPSRYVSKNNLNIARVDWLQARVPDARIVLPFREPFEHAASLLRQHRNFSAMHAEDEFARSYMAGIGHFDFGANLRPVNFDKWRSDGPDLDPMTLEFWLNYWCATYEHLLARQGERVALFDFDAMCADPIPPLERLADFAGIANHEAFLAQAGRIAPPRAHAPDVTGLPTALVERVRAIEPALRRAAL